MAKNFYTSASVTRPNNVTAYTALDVIGQDGGTAIMTFSRIGNVGGYSEITDVNLRVDVNAIWAGSGAFRLHLYNASPTSVTDNDAFNLVSADRSKYLGYVDIAAPVDAGDTLYSQNKGVNKTILLAPDVNTVYGVLQTIAGYTPAASEVYTVEVVAVEPA